MQRSNMHMDLIKSPNSENYYQEDSRFYLILGFVSSHSIAGFFFFSSILKAPINNGRHHFKPLDHCTTRPYDFSTIWN